MPIADRWQHCLVAKGADFESFWKSYCDAEKPRIGYILGLGFDPRMCQALEKVVAGGALLQEALVLKLDYGQGAGEPEVDVKANLAKAHQLLAKTKILEGNVPISAGKHLGQSSAQTRQLVDQFITKSDATDFVIDLNATPKSVGLTAIMAALQTSDRLRPKRLINIHVVVGYNPALDESIEQLDVQRDAFLLNGLLEGFEEESTQQPKTIWMPLLGRGKRQELDAIKGKWSATDVCAVVPSPSRDPRLGDDLVVDYLEALQTDKDHDVARNILRVSEGDPIEAYAELISTIREFGITYKLLGGCRVLLSPHASKLLSIAALLAAYDARGQSLCQGVSLALVETRAYRRNAAPAAPTTFYTLWLAGAPYQ